MCRSNQRGGSTSTYLTIPPTTIRSTYEYLPVQLCAAHRLHEERKLYIRLCIQCPVGTALFQLVSDRHPLCSFYLCIKSDSGPILFLELPVAGSLPYAHLRQCLCALYPLFSFAFCFLEYFVLRLFLFHYVTVDLDLYIITLACLSFASWPCLQSKQRNNTTTINLQTSIVMMPGCYMYRYISRSCDFVDRYTRIGLPDLD